MKCPKCGGEIAFYDLRPNCKHCGVNIYYYSQDALLAHDAKRTELEAAAARMLIARIKASFVGGALQIARLVFVLLTATALLLPFGSVKYHLPLFENGFSAGIIGLVQAIQNGMLLLLPQLLQGSLLAPQTRAAAAFLGCLLVMVLFTLVMLMMYILSFTDLEKSTKRMRNLGLVGAVVALLTQIAALAISLTVPDSALATVLHGYGGAAACAVFLIHFFLNRALLKKGIRATYREFDPKRKALLKQVRAGEVDLDQLPLPIFESEEEHAARMAALHASDAEAAKDAAEESEAKEGAQ